MHETIPEHRSERTLDLHFVVIPPRIGQFEGLPAIDVEAVTLQDGAEQIGAQHSLRLQELVKLSKHQDDILQVQRMSTTMTKPRLRHRHTAAAHNCPHPKTPLQHEDKGAILIRFVGDSKRIRWIHPFCKRSQIKSLKWF